MVFMKQFPKIDPANTEDAVKKLSNHLRYLQDQLEYILNDLDNRIPDSDFNQSLTSMRRENQ